MDHHKQKYRDHHDKKPYSRESEKKSYSNSKDDYNKDRSSSGGGGAGARSYKDKKTDYNQDRKYGKHDVKKEEDNVPIEDKEQPSLALSGNLAKDTNTFNGIVIKYNEPPEARKPKKRWRLYVFKGEEELPFYQIHRQSAYLFGRERKIADIPVDHPSCSKQHAVFQFRSVQHTKDDGVQTRIIKPYIIDLGATNGTYINNERIEAQRYYELKEKDVLKFGFSSREYVLLHEDSKANDSLDEDESSSDDDEAPVALKKSKKKEEEEKSDDSDDD